MTSYIGHNNKISNGTVTVSNEATGFAKENAYDWIGATQWKPGATGSQWLQVTFSGPTSIDYMGVAFHNLGTESATIAFQYLDETASPGTWTDLVTAITPTNDNSLFRTFTNQNATSYRILITNCTVDTVIGILSMGDVLALPYAPRTGFISPRNNRENKISNTVSMGGVFLGRTQYAEGRKFTIQQDNVTETWIDANWDTLLADILLHPFFYVSDYENRPNESPICWTDGKIKYPSYTEYGEPFLAFSIPCRGKL